MGINPGIRSSYLQALGIALAQHADSHLCNRQVFELANGCFSSSRCSYLRAWVFFQSSASTCQFMQEVVTNKVVSHCSG